MPRKPKVEPGAMLEMANPEILARMEAPRKTPRMRRSKGFEQQQRAQGRRVVAAPEPKPAEEAPAGDPFAEARAIPLRNRKWTVAELNDYEQLTALPVSGKCTCGSKPYSWTNAHGYSLSKRNENIGYFCSHVAHGGNGRFWLFSEVYVPKKRGRPRKNLQPEFKDEPLNQ